MKTIISVGLNIPSDEYDYIPLDSDSSLSEADIVVFCPDIKNAYYELDSLIPKYSGKPLYDSNSSFIIRENINHWKREILNFLRNDKTLIFLLKRKKDFYVYTGQTQRSGTGRNQKVTNLVEKLNNYEFLPISLEVYNATGKNIYPNSSLVREFYNSFKKFLYFEAYIDSEKVTSPLFTTKNKDKKLGAHLKVENGHLLFFPMINLYIDDLFDFENEVWKEEGLILGNRFKTSLVEIDKHIRGRMSKTPAPNWLNTEHYEIKSAQNTKSLIEKNNNCINKLIKENENLREVLLEQENIKDLLFETGKQLELAVIKALKLLGYEVENYNDGVLEIDQIIL